MSAVTVLCELQKGQLKDTSSFGFCFFGGGFDDFLLPIKGYLPGASLAGRLRNWLWVQGETANDQRSMALAG